VLSGSAHSFLQWWWHSGSFCLWSCLPLACELSHACYVVMLQIEQVRADGMHVRYRAFDQGHLAAGTWQ
jgi:hypothetical protein